MTQNNIISLEERDINKQKWIIFYRHNIHRFIEMHLGIQLYPYQWLDMYAMGNNVKYLGIKSRGTAKSWEAGLFGCAYAILYPNAQIVLVAESKKQASIIIDKKIRPLADEYVNLGCEIKNIKVNNNDYEVEFYNGSIMFVVPLTERARGNRADLIIYEEFRRLDREKVKSIIIPFKKPRSARYLMNPKYKHLIETPREIYITSSGRDTEDWWGDAEVIIRQFIQNKQTAVLFADFIIALKYGLKTKDDILSDKEMMGNETFMMEYGNILVRENKDAFFTNAMFSTHRVLKQAYYPQNRTTYNPNKNIYAPQLKDGEILIMTVDIAMRANKHNDNTIIGISKLSPTKKGYVQHYIYIETMKGRNTLVQATRIKQLHSDFNVSYIILDILGNGIGIYDNLTETTVDNSRGIEHPALTVMYHETISQQTYKDLKDRTVAINAIPIIYPISANDKFNSDIAYLTRDLLNSDMIRFLCEPIEAESYLIESSNLFDVKNDIKNISWFLAPYYQTTELIGEACALRPTYTGNMVKLTSKGKKDRYTMLAYSSYFVYNILNTNIVREKKDADFKQYCVVSQGVNTSNKRFGSNNRFSQNNRKLFGR